ncbi:hypothetical protein GT360_08265 [Vibrio astriarenae]|uniref:Uncharacterized protein n=1 Tax=Vibrio astriarenae TaxID=1481923 RepID=A0A7Z2YDP3_9VIBR|nr:hypothetical protein [Vibrio astriarenae]QIA63512.1 hypothetical protein GT360_08265 [Vibrio astriarenae]
MAQTQIQKVRDLLIATRYGVSASEMPITIQVPQDEALEIIEQLKASGEDIHSLGEGTNAKELVLYSIGKIDEGITPT